MDLLQEDFEGIAQALIDFAINEDGTDAAYEPLINHLVNTHRASYISGILSGGISGYGAMVEIISMYVPNVEKKGWDENPFNNPEIKRKNIALQILDQKSKPWKDATVLYPDQPYMGSLVSPVKIKRDVYYGYGTKISNPETYLSKILNEVDQIRLGKNAAMPIYFSLESSGNETLDTINSSLSDANSNVNALVDLGSELSSNTVNEDNSTITPNNDLETDSTSNTSTNDDSDLNAIGNSGYTVREQIINYQENSIYVVVNGPTWQDAKETSKKLGGELLTINNESENNFIGNEFSKSKYSYEGDNASWAPNEHSINHYWTGAKLNLKNDWEWDSGQDFNINLSSLLINNNASSHNVLLATFNNPNHHSNIYLDDSPDIHNSWKIKGIAEIPLIKDEKKYSGIFSDYIFYNKGDGIYQIEHDDIKDSITGIHTLTFSDKSINLINDVIGTFDQVTGLNTDSGRMFRLYNAAFKRLPDPEGLAYWIENFSSKKNSIRVISESFLASNEFAELYGEKISDSIYVNTLYKNVLGRAADNEGLNYWTSQLSSGRETRAEALLGFAESAENKALFTEMTGFS